MRAIWLGALAVGWLLGCEVPPVSIEPFYRPGDLSAGTTVEGEWLSLSDTADSAVLTVRRTGYYRYDVVETDGRDTLAYTAYAFTLGSGYGVDLTAAAVHPAPLMLPVHMFGRYAVHEDTLWFGFASDSVWLARLGSSGSRGIQWLKSSKAGVLLSGPPDSLHAIALELTADTTVDWNVRGYLRRPAATGVPEVAGVP